jgi:alpha-ribazole phosphatase
VCANRRILPESALNSRIFGTSMKNMIEVTIIRHAETELNVVGVYQGRTDVSVGKRGMEELQSAPAHPEVERVFVSPMLRTRQTAKTLFPNAEMVLIDELKEIDFGDFEGKTGEELDQDSSLHDAYWHWKQGGEDASCPNGESIYEVAQRVTAAFDRIVDEAREGERVYVVAHGGIIMAMMSIFAGTMKDYFSFWIENLHGYHVIVDKNEWKSNRRFNSYKPYSALDEE